MKVRKLTQALIIFKVVKVWYGCGGQTFTTTDMPLLKTQLDSIHTGRADPSRYLIIGFDTEYQRYADEDTRTLNNEVLSYQYCCTVIERDGDDASARFGQDY